MYFSGCLHLQHKNLTRGVSQWGPGNMTRDYDTTEEMTQAVVDSLQIIPEDAYFFILGDMLFGDKAQINNYLDKIPTKKLLYLNGNHCDWLRKELVKNSKLKDRFLWIGDYLEIYWGNKLVVMSHYPFASWNEMGHGSYMIHSHSHGSYVPGLPGTKDQGKILDVGWDVHHKPIDMHEIAGIMDSKQFVQVDHHNPLTT